MAIWDKVKDIVNQGNDIDDILLRVASGNVLGLNGRLPGGNAWNGIIEPTMQYWMDNPDIKRAIGNAQYANARYGLGAAPDPVKDAAEFLIPFVEPKGDYEGRIKAYKEGGGRAVWEYDQSDRDKIERGLVDIGIDPTTYLTAGGESVGSRVGAKGMEIATRGGKVNSLLGTLVMGGSKAIKVAELPDLIADRAVAPVVGKLAQTRPGQWISGLSPRETVRRTADTIDPLYRQIEAEKIGTGKLQQGYAEGLANRPAGVLSDSTDPRRIATNTLNLMNNGKPVTEDMVSTWEAVRGPHAVSGKNRMVDIAPEMYRELKSVRDSLVGKKITWLPGSTRSDINRTLINDYEKKGIITKQERFDIMSSVDQYKKHGLDVLHDQPEELLTARIRDVFDSDPTMPTLSDDQNALMFDTKHTAGVMKDVPYYDSIKAAEQEFIADRKKVKDAIGKAAWPITAFGRDRDMIRGIIKDSPVKGIVNKWMADNVDIMHTNVQDAAFAKFKRHLYTEAGVGLETDRSWFGAAANVWKGTALLSPRYHTSAIASNYINVMLREGPGSWFPTLGEHLKQARLASRADPNLRDAIANSAVIQDYADYGRLKANPNIVAAGMANYEAGVVHNAQRVLGKQIGRPTGRALDWNRRIAGAFDTSSRLVLENEKFKAYFVERIPRITDGVRKAAAKEGLQLDPNLSLMPFRNPEMLLGYYRGLGFKEGTARHLTREVARLRNEAEKDALKHVHKSLFSYYRSSADELISKVVPFHYYASRSSLLYFEEVMRNPVLLVNVARMTDELFRDYKNSGLSARQKGWLRIMGGTHGYSLLMNPDALLGFTRAMGLMGDDYENDETQLGGILKWMKAGGYGMFPWVDGMFNMMGAYGDTFEPDMLGVRHRALVGSLVNYVAAETGLGDTGQMQAAPYAELNAKAREHVSTWAASFMPGWMSQPVQAKANDSGTIAEASMEKLIESRILHNHPDLTYEQLFEIMNDPDNPELKQAWEDTASAGMVNQLLSFFAPTGVKVRDDDTDARGALMGVTYEWADKLGMNPYDVTPNSDAQFAIDYKRQTGKEWKPGDFDQAVLLNQLMTATPEARPFLVKVEQYKAIGSPMGKAVADQYNKIYSGEYVPPGFEKPAPGDREAVKDMATMWLSQQSKERQFAYQQLRELQSAFEQTSPQFFEYKEWGRSMGYLRNLLGGDLSLYRERVTRGNANAAKFFDAKRRALIERGITDPNELREEMDQITTSPDAWLAVTGVAKARSQQAPLPINQPGQPYDPNQGMIDQFKGYSDDSQQQGQQATFGQRAGNLLRNR